MHLIRTVIVSVLSLSTLAVGCMAQPVQNPLPLEQTKEGVTLCITQAGFFNPGEVYKGINASQTWGASMNGRRSFLVRYRLRREGAAPSMAGAPSRDAPDAPSGSERYYKAMRFRDSATTMRLFSPSGEVLTPSGGAGEEGGQQQLQWVAVDPHWDHVNLEVLALDPAAPISATGHFQENLSFKNVPIPRHLDVPLDLDQTLTTSHGTKVTLKSITAHATQDEQGKTHGDLELALSWKAPAAMPDLLAQLALDGTFTDDGKALPLPGGSGSEMSDEKTILHLHIAPPPGLKEITVAVEVSETASSLRQTKSYRRFLTELKLPHGADSPPRLLPPLQAVESGGAHGALEPPKSLGETGGTHTWLWLRDAKALANGVPVSTEATDVAPTAKESADAKSADAEAVAKIPEWFPKELKAHDQDGHELQISWDTLWDKRGPSDDERIAWHSDNTPTLPGEHCHALRIGWGDERRPQKVDVEATVESMLHERYAARFDDILLPVGGATVKDNKPASTKQGGQILLRAIKRFSNLSDLPGISPDIRPYLRFPGGLAVVFEIVPALKSSRITCQATVAEDEAGRSLKGTNYGNILIINSDALHPLAAHDGAGKDRWWTVFLGTPAPDAKQLKLQLVADEFQPLDQQAMLVFPDILSHPPAK